MAASLNILSSLVEKLVVQPELASGYLAPQASALLLELLHGCAWQVLPLLPLAYQASALLVSYKRVLLLSC